MTIVTLTPQHLPILSRWQYMADIPGLYADVLEQLYGFSIA